MYSQNTNKIIIKLLRYVMAEKVQPGKYIVQFQMKRQPNSTYVALDNIKMTLHELAKTDDEIDPTPTTTTTTTTTTGNILISRKKKLFLKNVIF